MIDEPFDAPSLQATVASEFPRVTEVIVGADGRNAGTRTFEPVEGPEVPIPLVAVTEKVYVEPGVRPWTVQVSVSGLVTV